VDNGRNPADVEWDTGVHSMFQLLIDEHTADGIADLESATTAVNATIVAHTDDGYIIDFHDETNARDFLKIAFPDNSDEYNSLFIKTGRARDSRR
jgi:hypothetical protein